MFGARCTTINVPSITATASETSPEPRPVIYSAGHDQVVRIRNNTFGSYVLISYDAAALMSFPNLSDVYKLPAGLSETFVMAKGQQLYCATPGGAGGEISIAVSEALPVDASMA
jgi:hypothetical protein